MCVCACVHVCVCVCACVCVCVCVCACVCACVRVCVCVCVHVCVRVCDGMQHVCPHPLGAPDGDVACVRCCAPHPQRLRFPSHARPLGRPFRPHQRRQGIVANGNPNKKRKSKGRKGRGRKGRKGRKGRGMRAFVCVPHGRGPLFRSPNLPYVWKQGERRAFEGVRLLLG